MPTPSALRELTVFRLCALVLLFVVPPGGRADFWVAPSGSDTAAGTAEHPFATPERARDAVRGVLGAPDFKGGTVTVWLRGGTYRRQQTLEFGNTDGGKTMQSPVVWRPVSGERVRWVGGVSLPPISDNPSVTQWKPVSNLAVRDRLAPEAQSQVLELDLKALGVDAFARMQSRGFSRPAVPSHSELVFSGRPMTLARWPNEGEFSRIAGFPATTGKGDDHGGTLGDLPAGFDYEGDRPKRWQDRSDIWVHGYWAWDWANSYERIAEWDLEKRRVKTASPHGLYGFRKGQRIHFLNILEELDQPGEWYLDRAAARLYFWPPRSAEPAAEVQLSLLRDPFVRCAGVTNLVIAGIEFEAACASGIEIRGGRAVRVEDCLLRNLGNTGVVVEGGFDHGVVRCDVFDTGDGGVSLTGGDRQTLVPGGHYVENCHFQRQGRWSKCYVPAIAMSGVGLRASHNLIHDHPHCAILFWGNDHLMEFNDIHHIALETGDVGAIYTGRDYSFRGNRIRHNFIHETGGVGMGSMGVYMDDCVSGTEVYGNVFYKVHWAMFIGGGRDHRVMNNIFVDCDPAVRMDARGMDRSPVWHGMVKDYMRKQLEAVPGALYRARYPEIRTLDPVYADAGDPGIPAVNNTVARNICVGKWLEVGWNATSENLKVEANLVTEDPGFVDLKARDFRLRADSPAWALGFERIPLERIGLQRPAASNSAAQ